MMTSEDIMRTKGEKIRKLENLAKACADAKDNDMKKMWYDKLITQYNISTIYVKLSFQHWHH